MCGLVCLGSASAVPSCPSRSPSSSAPGAPPTPTPTTRPRSCRARNPQHRRQDDARYQCACVVVCLWGTVLNGAHALSRLSASSARCSRGTRGATAREAGSGWAGIAIEPPPQKVTADNAETVYANADPHGSRPSTSTRPTHGSLPACTRAASSSGTTRRKRS